MADNLLDWFDELKKPGLVPPATYDNIISRLVREVVSLRETVDGLQRKLEYERKMGMSNE